MHCKYQEHYVKTVCKLWQNQLTTETDSEIEEACSTVDIKSLGYSRANQSLDDIAIIDESIVDVSLGKWFGIVGHIR